LERRGCAAGLSARARQANLRRAYGQFNEELMEGCAKQAEFRAIIFALSYFHAAAGAQEVRRGQPAGRHVRCARRARRPCGALLFRKGF